MNLSQKIYSVTELNSQIKQTLENTFASIWLSGEISNFKAHSSGHYYFSLKDKGAQISAVMFKGSNRLLKFQLEDGLEVVANGRVTAYEPRGSYQIVLEYVEPKGLGALQLALNVIKGINLYQGTIESSPEAKANLAKWSKSKDVALAEEAKKALGKLK